MAPVEIKYFQTTRGSAPALDFIKEYDDKTQEDQEQDGKGQSKIRAVIEQLSKQGHDCKDPYCRHLKEKIYELRARSGKLRLRLLFFFHKRTAVVLSHGFTKKRDKVPPKEIKKAIKHRELFESDPTRYTYQHGGE